MNLYATSADPLACAEALDDKTLETNCVELPVLIRQAVIIDETTREDHPVTKWMMASSSNALWAFAVAKYNCEEYAKRSAVLHPSEKELNALFPLLYNLPDTRHDQSEWSKEKYFPRDWANASGIEGADPGVAYRILLNNMWDDATEVPIWTNRKPPKWIRWRFTKEVVSTDPNAVISTRYYYAQKNRPWRPKGDK